MNNQFTENYYGYGRTDLNEMNATELKSELARIEKEIKNMQEELDNSGNHPSYVMKEELTSLNWYRDKIEKTILDRKDGNVAVESIDDMIKDLDRKYEKGIISKDYHDQYVNKLDSKRELYEENKKAQKEREEKALKLKEEKYKKSHFFKNFKKRLEDYKKK